MVQLMAALGAATAAAGTLNSLLSLYPPFTTARARFTYNLSPNMLPDLNTLASMFWRQEIGEQEYLQKAREIGFEADIAGKYQRSLRQLLGARDYITLYRRKEIDRTTLDASLLRLGFPKADVNTLLKATEFFPQPTDLVRFAVREVYNKQTRDAFGMDDDISDQYIQEAEKSGLPEDQARNYWAAHWELPSVNQAFEMYQRDVITREQLIMVLKALDVMPFWRDSLLKIAYNPMTRVDVRRMHALGVIDEKEVERRYRHQGMSPEDAKLMTDFTVAYNTREEGSASQSKILEAYRKDIITEEQARQWLTQLKYGDDTITLLMATADFDKALTEADELKTDLFERYYMGQLTVEQVRSELDSTGVPAAYVDSVMRELSRQTNRKVKLPSKEDITSWFQLGLISEQDFAARMRALGYSEQDTLLYLSQLGAEETEPEVKLLAIDTYYRWFKKGMIDQQTFRRYGLAKGISEDDIAIMILEVTGA